MMQCLEPRLLCGLSKSSMIELQVLQLVENLGFSCQLSLALPCSLFMQDASHLHFLSSFL